MVEKVDLVGLRERLKKLGVDIDGPSRQQASSPAMMAPKQHNAISDKSWNASFDRNKREVMDLLERCNKVEAALNAADDGPQDKATPITAWHTGGSAAKAAARRSPGGHTTFTATASPATATAAATPALNALLFEERRQARRQQQQQAAQQAAARLSAPARPAGRSVAAGRLPTAAGVAGGRRLAGAEGQLGGGSLSRSSPLACVLSQYKEAQASWANEKAQLRREAVAQRKRASTSEAELAKAQRLAAQRALDIQALRAALKGRDTQLAEASARMHTMDEALSRANEVAAERLAALTSERDDLLGLLSSTLERLEGVEGVVAAAGATSAVMEGRMAELEGERQAALQQAAESKAEAAQLAEARQRLVWQSRLLEKMSEVQLRHNTRKSAAIRDLLGSQALGGQEEPGDGSSSCEEEHQEEDWVGSGDAAALLGELTRGLQGR